MSQFEPSYERYQRQIILQPFGEESQQKLSSASVLVVGAGGLGCPALQYLVAAGLGTIGIVDDDVVSLHNLHRQILFTTADIGQKKVDVAAERLHQMNPEVNIVRLPYRLTTQNAVGVLESFDLIVDATDNFATRYLINDACVLLKKTFVYGGISSFEGQVAVFNADEESVNYRDLFPQPPQPGSILNCAEAGVLGVLPGIIGTMQATEIIKLVTGIGEPLINQLFTYNALNNQSHVFNLVAKKETSLMIPKTPEALLQMDYESSCESPLAVVEEITATELDKIISSNVVLIDIREPGEQPVLAGVDHRKIPLSQLKESIPTLAEDIVVLICQSGKRSREAAKILSASFGSSKKVYGLKGGILQWKQHGEKA